MIFILALMRCVVLASIASSRQRLFRAVHARASSAARQTIPLKAPLSEPTSLGSAPWLKPCGCPVGGTPVLAADTELRMAAAVLAAPRPRTLPALTPELRSRSPVAACTAVLQDAFDNRQNHS